MNALCNLLNLLFPSGSLRTLRNLTVVAVILLGCCGTASGQTFDFSTGLDGWSTVGPLDGSGASIPGTGVFSPLTYFASTPMYAYFSVRGSIVGTTGNWIMQAWSPDLSASTYTPWQKAIGYSVKLYNGTGNAQLWANLYVQVYDYNTATLRQFFSGTAQPLAIGTWTTMSFDWSGATNFPTSYQVRAVFVDIWGAMGANYAGDVGIDDVVAVTDTTLPTVTITSPTTNPTYTTSASTIDLAGTASDNNRVALVSWMVSSTEQSGPATGTNNWSATGIPLQVGQNVITMAAQDAAQNYQYVDLTVNRTIPVTVTTNPTGRTITVDNIDYTAPQTFDWDLDSVHTIETPSPQTTTGTRYVFADWSDGGAISHLVTATEAVTTYTANFTTQYLLTTAVAPAGGGGVAANPTSPDGYYSSGTVVQVTANPSPYSNFTGWTGDLTGPGNPQSVTMSAPRSVTANFVAIVTDITINTNPPGRSFTADGVGYTAPRTFSWNAGSTHTIGTTSPQTATGTRYLFAGWSDQGLISHTITVFTAPTTYTANFTTQYLLTTAVSGNGSISATPTSADGYYNSDTSVQLTATPLLVNLFTGWSGDLTGTVNPQSIVMSAPRSVTASFVLETTDITINTNPPGRTFTVDGTDYTTARTFSWDVGSRHTIATTSPQTATGTRYIFANWSDEGAISHTIGVGELPETYTANFTTQYSLATAVSPSGSGTVSANPPSADGFYGSAASVQVTATPVAENKFAGWSGDLTGTANPQTIVMSAPRSVTASFSTCSLAISPDSGNHGSGADSGSVAVIGSQGCSWVATSGDIWISIDSGSQGSGSGSVTYSVTANRGAGTRTGSLTIAGNTFTVTQEGAGFDLPFISGLQPQPAIAGGPGFNLEVTGSNFVNGSRVYWNGSARTTEFVGVGQLKAAIPASDIAGAGTAQVSVVNPSTAVSDEKPFTIQSFVPVPKVTVLSPGSMVQGGSGFTLTVIGSGFVPDSKVKWNGLERGTSFESGTILTAVIPASDLAKAADATVTVENPLPGGPSAGVAFQVLTGTVITDVSPSSMLPGSAGFLLSVFGANFLQGTGGGQSAGVRHAAENEPTVLWNGVALPTVVVSSTELQATVPTELVPPSGTGVVSVSGGGSGASNVVPVPVTATRPTPLLSDLSPRNAVPGGAQFTLTLQGKNFTDGAKVLWNGQERATQFLDSTKLQAIIPDSDIVAIGASRVSVLNPAPGGGESNAQPFGHVQTLLFPRLTNAARSAGSALDDGERTGMAITNLAATSEKLTFTALGMDGTPISGTGVTNPAVITLEPGRQYALVGFQLFGNGLPADTPIGWFKMESTGSGTTGFFLMYSDTLSVLDGADVSSATYTTSVATEIGDQGYTELHVVNTEAQPAEVALELYGPDGQLRAPVVQRTLEAGTELVAAVSDLFPGVAAGSSDYVRVVSNHKVLLFERMGKAGQYVSTLNGQDVSGGGSVVYSPQYAVGGGVYRTTLSVVNLEDRSGVVTMRLVDKNGTVLAGPLERTIAARGKLAITDQKFFVDAGGTLKDGYVEVRSDGVRLAGSVVFGDPGQQQFSTALPLVGGLLTDMVFNQVASDPTYFTGIAIVNPNPGPVTARIEVYDANGTLVTSADQPIPANGRVSKLLPEYCPDLQGKTRDGGYIRVHTDAGVASFALFGTTALSSLSAVPAQQVRQ